MQILLEPTPPSTFINLADLTTEHLIYAITLYEDGGHILKLHQKKLNWFIWIGLSDSVKLESNRSYTNFVSIKAAIMGLRNETGLGRKILHFEAFEPGYPDFLENLFKVYKDLKEGL
jgi:hypothetical protein